MKLLFIVLFLGIILWKGASGVNKGFVFQMGRGSIFKWEVCSMGGGIGFDRGGSKKIKGCRGHTWPLILSENKPVLSQHKQYYHMLYYMMVIWQSQTTQYIKIQSRSCNDACHIKHLLSCKTKTAYMFSKWTILSPKILKKYTMVLNWIPFFFYFKAVTLR